MGKLVERPQEDSAGTFDLRDGVRMSRARFHRLYSLAPEKTRAELIGGVVHMASPLKYEHGEIHFSLGWLFCYYVGLTPGVGTSDNATVQLGDDSEPQPDGLLRILSEFGGQSTISDDGYVEGPPELLAEIALSSLHLDLHAKRDEYSRNGVQEYLVLDLRDNRLHWFDLKENLELQPDADGIYRIQTFPGLWIDADAVFTGNFNKLSSAFHAGLASPEHAAFVARLAANGALQS